MFALDLFNNDHERRLTEGAVDRLEQRRIDDLAMKMDDLVARAKQATTPEHKSALVKEFQKCKAERDSYYKIKDECMGYGSLVGEENVNEGAMKQWLWKEAERLDLDDFVANAGEYGMSPEEAVEWWNSINGPLDEAGIGQDIVNKTEKMARATPSTPTGKVASTVKNAAKWLAGKGGPGKEGPTYESQKKNSEEVDEAGGGWGLDPKTRLELKKRKERQKTIAKWAGRPVPPQEPKEKEINEGQQLHVGDPIIVTGPNEFEGKTGEVAEFSPSGKFVVVNLYNHGEHSMHLSDVEYNQYADDQAEEDDWYDDQEDTMEGWSNKMVAQRTGQAPTPYSIYIKGKEWKSFADDDHAENVANKLRAKFKQEGKDPSVITIAPTDYNKGMDEAYSKTPPNLEVLRDLAQQWQDGSDTAYDEIANLGWNIADDRKGVYIIKQSDMSGRSKIYFPELTAEATNRHFGPKGAGTELARQIRAELASTQPRKGTPVPAKEFAQGIEKDLQKAMKPKIQVKKNKDVAEGEGRVDPILIKALNNMPDGLATHGQVLNACYDAYAMELGKMRMKSEYGTTRVYIPKLMDLYKDKHGLTFNEAQTDYSKRRQRERDVDAGKPVAKPRQSKMTDYQKRRAEQKRQEALGENQDTSGVESAIIRRIMIAHTDLLKQFGPEKVMQAAEEVAYNVGDVDEIGTSDVSAYVNQVKQILGAE
jgi:hypothetical protein